MKRPAWIAASLLALFAVQQAWAEKPGRPDLKGEVPVKPEGLQGQLLRRDLAQQGQQGQNGHPHLTPEERRKLRSDINEAGRQLYRRDSDQRPL